MHPKFDLTGVRIHDLQIIIVQFHVTEMPALIIRPSVTTPKFDLTDIVHSPNDGTNQSVPDYVPFYQHFIPLQIRFQQIDMHI